MLETDEEEICGAANQVVFHKENESDMTNELWDDTALIKAYDKAVSQAHNQFSELSAVGSKKGNRRKGKNKNKSKAKHWRVGDKCRAIYSEDNQIYEAQITQLVGTDKCTVLYTEYGNEEQQLLTDLLQPRELPETHKRRAQGSTASTIYSSSTSEHSGSGNPAASLNQMGATAYMNTTFMPPPSRPTGPGPSFVPPPPPSLPDMGSCSDEEALHSMLISWYMSGYHTGYFQGLKQGRNDGRSSGT